MWLPSVSNELVVIGPYQRHITSQARAGPPPGLFVALHPIAALKFKLMAVLLNIKNLTLLWNKKNFLIL